MVFLVKTTAGAPRAASPALVRTSSPIEAWQDTFASWQHEFDKKFQAGITELDHRNRLKEPNCWKERVSRVKKSPADAARLRELAAATCPRRSPAEVDRIAHDPEVIVLMETYGDRAASPRRCGPPVPGLRGPARRAVRGVVRVFSPLRRGQAGQHLDLPRLPRTAWTTRRRWAST